MILHAGDLVEAAVLDRLGGIAPLRAVHGNMDDDKVCSRLPEKDIIEIGGLRLGLVHGHGSPAHLLETVKAEFSGVDAIVFGHTHTAVNVVKDGILFFNPGSPTDKIFATSNSYGILEVNGKIIEGRIVRLR